MSTCPKFMLRGEFEIHSTFKPELGKRFVLAENGVEKAMIKERVVGVGKNVFQLMGKDGKTLIADGRSHIVSLGRRKIGIQDCKKNKLIGSIRGRFIEGFSPLKDKFDILDAQDKVVARVTVGTLLQDMTIRKARGVGEEGDSGPVVATVVNRKFSQKRKGLKEFLREGWAEKE